MQYSSTFARSNSVIKIKQVPGGKCSIDGPSGYIKDMYIVDIYVVEDTYYFAHSDAYIT